ncbi:unnamed protein product [Bursaphelenchus xylophilus]|uniref:(pine wood nematode) hypothetical protein n=1 Tax=Bursaphelenchus xylophilus TaxID=6326 RepID=A0A1I7RHN1_BURXY|nr:unnamed protein product [Bursaphelenchus xylophilus]CAG9115568.1 unnamed protein product [Bursaphelenchus xylophilus]
MMVNNDDVFGMSTAAREREIAILERTIEDSTREVQKLAGDNFLYINDILKSCSDLETAKSLQKLDDLVSKLQKQVTEAAKKLEAPSLSGKIDVIRGIEKRLERFSELRTAIRSLNTDFSQLTSYRDYALKLKNMKGYKDVITLSRYDLKDDYPEEDIMVKFNAEVDLEIERFKKYLEGIFDTFIVITKDVENLNKTTLIINSEDPTLICDCLDSLTVLHAFDEKFKELSTVIWTDFCEVLMNSVDPDQQITITTEGPLRKRFVSESKPKRGEKQNVQKLIISLENFFENLSDVLKDIRIGESLVLLIGREIGGRLIETLVIRCSAASVSIKKTDEEKLKKLKGMIKQFDDRMRELHFFDDRMSAESVLNRSNRLFVNQRCRAFLAAARNLIAKPYIDLVEVFRSPKPSDPELEKLSKDLGHLKINTTDLTKEEGLRLFELQKCKISDSVYKLVLLLKSLFDLAFETKEQLEAVNFFQAALLIIDTFLVSTPRLHQQALLSVPQTSAIFYNNCQYLFHNLFVFKIECEQKLAGQSNIKSEDLNFTKQFKELRSSGLKFLDQQINSVKRNLSVALNEDNLFVNIDASEGNRERVEKTLNGCVMELNRLRSVWSEVMSDSVLSISMGVLVAHLLSLLSKAILSKEDITMTDAESMAVLFSEVMRKSRKLMTMNGAEGIHSICHREYVRLEEVIFVLNGNLNNVSNRWCNGKGTLAEYLKAFEVRGLVCALFQNTDKRSALLDQIKNPE